MNNETQELNVIIIPDTFQGERLDKVLPQLIPDHSRASLQTFLKAGDILVDGQIASGKVAVKGGECLQVNLPDGVDQAFDWQAEDLPLNIVFEDDHLLVINKPIDQVVHPAAGNWSGTLVNGLLFYHPALQQLPRAGIVHRLDKDTSGLLVVAKTAAAYHSLVQQLQTRQVKRQYCALVYGEVITGGTVNAALGRSHHDRQKIAIVTHGKEAITHYRVRERFDDFTLLKVLLETGRTHQIRVHLTSIRHPLVGDATYGPGLRLPRHACEELKALLKTFKHQALHAERLSFLHPHSRTTVRFKAPLPEDFQQLVDVLRDEHSGNNSAIVDEEDYYWDEE